MKLLRQVTLNGSVVPLASLRVTLALNGSGHATAICPGDRREAAAPLGKPALARIAMGYAAEGKIHRVLSGFAQEARLVESGATRLLLRDAAAVLDAPLRAHLRHVTPLQALAAIEAACGASFLAPQGAIYLKERLPYFSSEGPCRRALDALGAAWGLADAVWSALPDGRIYWGRIEDSPFAAGEPIPLDAALIQARDDVQHKITLPVIPRLRPGMRLALEGRAVWIRALEFTDDTMEVECSAIA